MAETEYRFPLPNELDSLNSLGQPGIYGKISHPSHTRQEQVHVQHHQGQGHVQHLQGQGHVQHLQGQGHMQQVQGQGHVQHHQGQGHVQHLQGQGHMQHLQGQGQGPVQHHQEQRQVQHVVRSSSSGRVQGQPDVLGHPSRNVSQGSAAMFDIEFPPDVAAMMVTGDNQKYDVNEKHHQVVHDPNGRTDLYTTHQKRTGVDSTYENQEMVSFSTQHFSSANPPPDDSASDDQYDLRLVGATDVETGAHLGYGGMLKVAETSEDSLSNFSQTYSVSSQNRYGSLSRSFSDSGHPANFTQHIAKIGETDMEAVSLESLASFTQQQAKQWEDTSEESLTGYDQQQSRVGVTTTQETTTRQHSSSMNKTHTLPPQRPKYEQNIPPPKPQYNTMRHLVSDSNVQQHRQDITSHTRTQSTPAFQEPGKGQNRNIKEYFSYDLQPGRVESPASSIAGSKVDITVNISEQTPKVQSRSETIERTVSDITQMVPDENVPPRPPPPVMPKPPKTPDLPPGTANYNYVERLTIRGVYPSESEYSASPDVTSDVFDSDLETMLTAASEHPPKQSDEPVQYVDGKCTCCPYGYHIDLTFLGYMAEKEQASYLSKLKKIKRNKRNLRKSMEAYVTQDSESQPAPDVLHNEALLTMVEKDEKATKGILSEIDSSVNETIDSIDSLMKSGPLKKRPKHPENCDSDFSYSSGPQTTSSPRPTQSLNTTGSTSSLSSLESSDKISKTVAQSQMSSVQSEHSTTTTTNITNIITSKEIAKSVEDLIEDSPATDPNAVTPEQLQVIRDQMKMSLQRMRDLEEQVKALPVLQVRISVLKEEKRLLMLQMEAQKNKKAPDVSTRSVGIGVEMNEKPKSRSIGVDHRPRTYNIGVGEHSVDEVIENVPTGRRSRSQSPSGRSFEITEFQSYRRNNLTSMNKYFAKTNSGRSTPVSFDGPDMVDSAIGDGDVSKIYYVQPDLVSEAQFSIEMNGLRPYHVPELVSSVERDREQEEFEALERALKEKTEETITLQRSMRQEVAPSDVNEFVIPSYHRQPDRQQSIVINEDVFRKETLQSPDSAVPFIPVERERVEDEVVEVVDGIQRPIPRRVGSHSSEHTSTHVLEKEVTTVYVNESKVKVAPERKRSIVVAPPELKKASRTIGIGDGDVFEEVKPAKPKTRSVGSMMQTVTRDVGVTFVAEVKEPKKPETRDIGVGIGDLDEMKVIETGEFGEYYHTVPVNEEFLKDRQGQQGGKMVTYSSNQQGQYSGQRSIKTTSSTTYTERKNILLQEERIKSALRDALHRSVKSVGIMCKMAVHDKGCETDLIKKRDSGFGDDTIDVEVRPLTDIRSIGVDVKPQHANKMTYIDKPFTYNAMTNTPIPQPKDRATNTTKVVSYPAAIQTDKKRTYNANVGTDMKVFMAFEQIKNAAVNTDTPRTRNSETNTERKSLKSENYDFSIYFRDGSSNTEEMSIQDLKLHDRGQNTMRIADREREMEDRIIHENARIAFASPTSPTSPMSPTGFDNVDGPLSFQQANGHSSGSHQVITRTVRHETSPVIVNRRVVSTGFSSSSGGSVSNSGFTDSSGTTGGTGFSSRSVSSSGMTVSGGTGLTGSMGSAGSSSGSVTGGGFTVTGGAGMAGSSSTSEGGQSRSTSSSEQTVETVTRTSTSSLQFAPNDMESMTSSSRSVTSRGFDVSGGTGSSSGSVSGGFSSSGTGMAGGTGSSSGSVSSRFSVSSGTGMAGGTGSSSGSVSSGFSVSSGTGMAGGTGSSSGSGSSGFSVSSGTGIAGGTGSSSGSVSGSSFSISSGTNTTGGDHSGSNFSSERTVETVTRSSTSSLHMEPRINLSLSSPIGEAMSNSGSMQMEGGSSRMVSSGGFKTISMSSRGGEASSMSQGLSSVTTGGSQTSSGGSVMESEIVRSEVSGDLSSAPSAGVSLDLTGGSVSSQSVTISGGASVGTSVSGGSVSESNREERGGAVQEDTISASKTSEVHATNFMVGGLLKGSTDGSLVFENKAAVGDTSVGSSVDRSDSGFTSMRTSEGMLNREESSVMTSSGGSFSEDSESSAAEELGKLGSGMSTGTGGGSMEMSVSGGSSSVSDVGRRVIVSQSETITTYSSSGSSTGSLDTIGEDRLTALPGEIKISRSVQEKVGERGDSDSEQSQSDVFGQENNGTIIRKHVLTTRSSIPVRSMRKEVHITRTVDQNGNENAGKLLTGSQGMASLMSAGQGVSVGGGGSGMMHSSRSTSSQSSEDGDGTGFTSFVSGGEMCIRTSAGKRGLMPGRSQVIVKGTTETTHSTSGSAGSPGGLKLQTFGLGKQTAIGASLSPVQTRSVTGGTEIIHSSSTGGEADFEVLAQLKELEKDIEASHSKHLTKDSGEFDTASFESDIKASQDKHFDSIKSKFLSGALHTKSEEHSEGEQSFLSTGAISLTPTTVSKISSSTVTVTMAPSDSIALAKTEDLDDPEIQDEEHVAESASSTSKSVSEDSLEHSGTFGGSTGSLRSIMKRSGSFEGNKGQKKELKFAVGTIGGAIKTIEHTASYISNSSDDGTSESESETDSDSDTSYEEGSYDGRQGCIVYLCKDDEAIAQGLPGAKMFDQNIRETFELSAELKNSCKLYGNYLEGNQELSEEDQKTHLTAIQGGWFKVSSERLANPHQVEDYMSSFNEINRELLPLVINLADTNGNCAIHYAVSHCNFEIVSLLLDTEMCDVNKQNRAGYTPIMLASLAQVQTDRHKEIVRRLFREGDVNVKATQAGQTALMLAVSHGKKDMVKLLLDCGADINAQDEDGSTALMCASEHGHTDIVKVLLAQPECDPSIVDQDGSTALAIAMEAGHRDIAVLLYAKRGPKSPVRSPVSILYNLNHN